MHVANSFFHTIDEIFRLLAEDVHFDRSYPSHFKLFSMLNEIGGLHHELLLKKNMIVELCVSSYGRLQ